MNLPFYDTMKQLQESCVMFPAFVGALEQMQSNLGLYRATGVAQNLLITGESGTGKSTLCQLFEERYPKAALPERDLIPVLNTSVPPAATIAGTVEAILRRLGDPDPERGTVSAKTARAVRIAKGVGVEMLLFDEAQHIQDRGRSQTQYFVGDWLKSFMDAVGKPVTLLGLPRTESLLQVNEQLRRRFTHRLSISIVQGEQSVHGEKGLALFTSLAAALPIPIDPRPYGWNELGVRLHFSTDGRIAYVKQLLVNAYKLAHGDRREKIDIADFAAAFTEVIWPNGVGALNPFNERFPLRPLDRLGEPFQKGEMYVRAQSRRRKE